MAIALPGSASGQAAPRGVDVSNWQGRIDWLQVGAAGYGFAFAKATEGMTFTDVTYPLNRSGTAAVGVRLGAYHFARPAGASDAAVAASAVAQADYFLAFAQPQPGDLLPALDLEQAGGLSSARLTAWARAWLEQVVARLGIRPVIYVSPKFWQSALGDTPVFAASGHQLWIANWTKAALPALPGAGWGGLGWTFWQWTNCEQVAGITGCVDGDRLNGLSLTEATVSPYPAGPPLSTAAPAIIGTPQVGQLLAATAGGWTGGKPVTFAYQWQRCDAVGAGCAPIGGAVKHTYTPIAADAGRALTVFVTAQTATGSAVSGSSPTLAVASAATAPAASAPAPISPPSIEGTAQAGLPLMALAGAWSGQPQLAHLSVAPLHGRWSSLRRDSGGGRGDVHDHA